MRGSASGSNVRYADDIEGTTWVLRCEDCARSGGQCLWPLTLEFWNPTRRSETGGRAGRSMARCRACWVRYDARAKRDRLHRDEALAQRNRDRNRAYKRLVGDTLNFKARERRAGRAA